MFPISFDESNGVIDKPPNVDREVCDALSVWRGDIPIESGEVIPGIVSCWKLTKEELDQINKTGRVWVYVYGYVQPMLSLSGIHPFKKE